MPCHSLPDHVVFERWQNITSLANSAFRVLHGGFFISLVDSMSAVNDKLAQLKWDVVPL